MNIYYESSFERDLKRIKDKNILKQVKHVLKEIKQADNFNTLKSLKKMKGHSTFYRIRIGNFRMGIEISEEKTIITRFLHRKDIYRYFP